MAHNARVEAKVKYVPRRFLYAARVERIDIADATTQHHDVRIEHVNDAGDAAAKIGYQAIDCAHSSGVFAALGALGNFGQRALFAR